MKKRKYDPRMAVLFMACAFGITLAALIALAAAQTYSAHVRRETYAEMLAGDILSLRDSLRAEDGRQEICMARIDARSAELLTEAEQQALRSALYGEDPEPLAREIEEAFLGNRFRASLLKSALRRFYSTHMAEKRETDAVADVPPARSKSVSAARLAGEYFGFAPLFRECDYTDGKAAYCRNAYAVFDMKTGKMTEFAVYRQAGRSVLDAEECLLRAVSFLENRQNIHPRSPQFLFSRTGISYILCPHRGGTALVGVREDSGSICLFVRSWKGMENEG